MFKPGLIFQSLCQMTEKIKNREITSVELVQTHIEHIKQYNPKLNAIITLDKASALKEAHRADQALQQGIDFGPLHGIPITIKDSFETAGLKTTAGHQGLKNYVPTKDAWAVDRLRQAGAIILGKTNLPTFALDYQTTNELFGKTNNPWDVTKTPGGSTGGGAAAIAAGFSPIDLGSDIGGSLRIPAHFCGTYSLKATDQWISNQGHLHEKPEQWHCHYHLGSIGLTARSIDDLELVFPILAGSHNQAPKYLEDKLKEKPIEDLRLAWFDHLPGLTIEQDIQDKLMEFTRSLSDQGISIDKKYPDDFDIEQTWLTWGELFGSQLGMNMNKLSRLLYRTMIKFLTRPFPTMRHLFQPHKANLYFQALSKREELITALDSFLEQVDAWIGPVAPVTAFDHMKPSLNIKPIPAYFKTFKVKNKSLPYYTAMQAYTTPFNLTGHPVVTIPLGLSRQGLPIGVQIIGKKWQDQQLLVLAKQLAAFSSGYQQPPIDDNNL